MKMNILFLIIIISNIFLVYSKYTYEIIQELIPKTMTFNAENINAFKIYKYIPICPESVNYKKDIYLQVFTSQIRTHYIYIYDDFSKIMQDSESKFINYINNIKTNTQSTFFLFSDLDCKKEYFFVLKPFIYPNLYPFEIVTGAHFNIIDANNDIITLSPELSNSFSFFQRNETKEEIIYYSHNETKYGLFYFSHYGTLKIMKNGEIIYTKQENEFEKYQKELLLEKNENYTIHFKGYDREKLFSLQLFNETPIIKYDIKNGPLSLYGSNVYIFEVNISKFEVNDIILLDIYGSDTYSVKYQYKCEYTENNFINLGVYSWHNYVPIRNTIGDSHLIIRIENFRNYIGKINFNIVNLIPEKIEEIHSDFEQKIIKGPKYYFIEYNKISNMNSFGIFANESFILFEEKYEDVFSLSQHYENAFITTFNNYEVNAVKRAIIYFNSSYDILFEIKKYNYSFFHRDNKKDLHYEYYQLCQGNNSLNEIYFYIDDYDIFQPLFGTYNSYFIKKEDVMNYSSLDFDNKELNKNYKISPKEGFLKIKCKNPLMIKHIFVYKAIRNLEEFELNSCQKYYLNLSTTHEGYTFNKSLINKDLQIRITIFGLEDDQFIELYFNEKFYNLSSKPFELNFTYEYYTPYLFSFSGLDKYKDQIIISEINVGYLPENITAIKQIDFNQSIGTLNLSKKEIVAIKVPQNFSNNLFDYSIYLQDYSSYNVYIDISYDTLEFQTINYKQIKNGISFAPLFKVNPYNYIENNLLTNNKFFYILLYFDNEADITAKIFIRKPKIFSDAKLNTFNYFPELSGENEKYYYQIEYPKLEGNYSYLFIQILGNQKTCEVLSKKNMQYFARRNEDIYYYYRYHYYIIPLNKAKNNYDYINFYSEFYGYINFIQIKDFFYPYTKYLSGKFIKNVEQINGKNELKIELNSLSYINKEIVKYYILINFDVKSKIEYYAIVIGNRKPNPINYEFLEIIEDKGINDTFTKEIEINIELYNDTNDFFIIPILKNTNLAIDNYIESRKFNYTNYYIKEEKNIFLYIFIPSIVAVVIIAIIVIVIILKKRAKKEIIIEKISNEELINNEK